MYRRKKKKPVHRTGQKAPRINISPAAFEKAFCNRLGQSPLEWVKAKVESGSQLDAIRYLYELSAAAIAQQNNCCAPCFDRYYAEYLESTKTKEVEPVERKTVKTHNKLVRDKIPEILKAAGKNCVIETLSDEEYITMLDEKLSEGVVKYQEKKTLEDLADLLEVMGAIVKARGHSWAELTAIRKKKCTEQGAYDKRILLKETII